MMKISGGKYAASALVITAAVLLVIYPKDTADAVRVGLMNCLNVIIPSLFAMIVISRIFISSGLYKLAGRPFGLIARYIFRIPEPMFPVFLISMAAGYPVGASLISEAYKEGGIEKEDAERLMCWCFGAGHAFIFSAVGQGVFGSARCGAAIFVSCIGANILLGIILSFGREIPEKYSYKNNTKLEFSAQLLMDSICGGGTAVLKMCAVVLFMSALISLPESLGITVPAAVKLGKLTGSDPYIVYTAMRSLAEITNLTREHFGGVSYLPLASALVSFGGLSVFMQIKSVCGELKTGKMMLARAAAAIMSYFICGKLFGVMYSEACVSVMAHSETVRHNNPISTVFLLIMTILLLSEKSVSKLKKM